MKSCFNEYFTTTYIVSKDQRKYRVLKEFGDNENASDILSDINSFIIEYLRYVRNKFIIQKRGNQNEINFVKRMLKNYNPDGIIENFPSGKGGDTSYVINKGKKFGICLRNKINNKFHTENTLKFVVLHELAHMGNKHYGHGYDFWAWMKFNLIQATEAGLYKPINYKLYPTNYCGLDVSFSPYYSDYDWNNERAR